MLNSQAAPAVPCLLVDSKQDNSTADLFSIVAPSLFRTQQHMLPANGKHCQIRAVSNALRPLHSSTCQYLAGLRLQLLVHVHHAKPVGTASACHISKFNLTIQLCETCILAAAAPLGAPVCRAGDCAHRLHLIVAEPRVVCLVQVGVIHVLIP